MLIKDNFSFTYYFLLSFDSCLRLRIQPFPLQNNHKTNTYDKKSQEFEFKFPRVGLEFPTLRHFSKCWVSIPEIIWRQIQKFCEGVHHRGAEHTKTWGLPFPFLITHILRKVGIKGTSADGPITESPHFGSIQWRQSLSHMPRAAPQPALQPEPDPAPEPEPMDIPEVPAEHEMAFEPHTEAAQSSLRSSLRGSLRSTTRSS
jgi:hypothetical protein